MLFLRGIFAGKKLVKKCFQKVIVKQLIITRLLKEKNVKSTDFDILKLNLFFYLYLVILG